jgi:uncharacterized membrane protein
MINLGDRSGMIDRGVLRRRWFLDLGGVQSMKSVMFLASAVALAVSGPALLTGAAQAAENEKCFGIAAAGQNDCQTASNSCAGQVSDAGRGDSWIYVPAGTCAKINGGSLEPKQG